MHYYQHHIGDFLKDTANLDDHQMATYLRMIWSYYGSEKPFDDDCEGIAFAVRSDEKTVRLILKHYFELTENEWHHNRCDREIAQYHSKAGKARDSANARWKNAKAMRTHSERNADEPKNDANQEPITNNQDKDQKPSRQTKVLASESFDSFWKLYPKKASKKDAIKAWSKIEPDKHPEIMQGLASHRVSQGWVRDDGQFIPNAATWLNAERWEDEVRPHVEGRPNTGAGSTGKPSLSEQVRQRNAERQAERDREAGQSAQGSAELFTSGMDDYGRDFEGEFSRINDLDGKIVVADDRPVWAQVD
jgi:uncharacterized protein YdaU (DUF1376 family)